MVIIHIIYISYYIFQILIYKNNLLNGCKILQIPGTLAQSGRTSHTENNFPQIAVSDNSI